MISTLKVINPNHQPSTSVSYNSRSFSRINICGALQSLVCYIILLCNNSMLYQSTRKLGEYGQLLIAVGASQISSVWVCRSSSSLFFFYFLPPIPGFYNRWQKHHQLNFLGLGQGQFLGNQLFAGVPSTLSIGCSPVV